MVGVLLSNLVIGEVLVDFTGGYEVVTLKITGVVIGGCDLNVTVCAKQGV